LKLTSTAIKHYIPEYDNDKSRVVQIAINKEAEREKERKRDVIYYVRWNKIPLMQQENTADTLYYKYLYINNTQLYTYIMRLAIMQLTKKK